MNLPPAGASLPDQPNPANAALDASDDRRRRVPMSEATQTLLVDALPGFHLHWFRESRVLRAKQAGYALVQPDEVFLNSTLIGAPRSLGGNTDLGSCVSVVGSVEGPMGMERAVLMKIKEEWWQEDSAALAERNLRVMRDIFGGERIASADGAAPKPMDPLTYLKGDMTSFDKGMKGPPATGQKPIMNRGMPKARTGGRFTI